MDAQIAALLLAFTLPIRRYGWYIDPNGARDEVIQLVADDLNLPIEGLTLQNSGRCVEPRATRWIPYNDQPTRGNCNGP